VHKPGRFKAASLPGPFAFFSQFGVALGLTLLVGCGPVVSVPPVNTATPTAPAPPSTLITPISTTVSPAVSSAFACELPRLGDTNTLGSVVFNPTSAIQYVLLRPTVVATGVALIVSSATWNNSHDSMLIQYQYGSQSINLTVFCKGDDDNNGITIMIDADKPGIVLIDSATWDDALKATSFTVPYYTSDVAYSSSLGSFINSWWDYTATHASRLVQNIVFYDPMTNNTFNPVHEILKVRASQLLADVFPDIPNSPSPYLGKLSGKMVINIWDSSFGKTLSGLQNLNGYTSGNCAVIIHNWQHYGYDDGLPQHLSANPNLGGDDGISAVSHQATADGCLFAVHENYIDYYPDYPAFDVSSVAVASTDTPLSGWLNSTTGIQSVQAKPMRMTAIASTQSPGIHHQYGTTATYIDVNSAVGVDYKQDMDSREPQAAQIGLWLNGATSLWSFERQTHQGPVFGEGLNHWYYSGLLDGVEAQLGAGNTPQNIGEDLPLFVDFDLDKIHPLQINHGMGLYERWSKSRSLSLSTLEHDAYRTQEIAYGHAPFLDRGEWEDVPLTFLENSLVSPVATAYGKSVPIAITYRVNGSWIDSSKAAKLAAKYPAQALSADGGIFTQVQVSYANGLTLIANAGDPYSWNGITIPRYGWAAVGAGINAYTAQCGATLCDFASTPSTFFANARSQSDYRNGWHFALPSVQALTSQDTSQDTISLSWQVLAGPSGSLSYRAFVHFVNDELISNLSEGIVFQADHDLAVPTNNWEPGETVSDGPTPIYLPHDLPDGNYSVRVGLYDPVTSQRADLAGNIDATGRVVVGHIAVHGSKLTFTSEVTAPDDERLNSQEVIVDFGSIKTDGMVRLQYASGTWTLTPMPPSRRFNVLLRKLEFPMPTIVQPASGASITPVDQGDFWQLPLTTAKSYSWAANCMACEVSSAETRNAKVK
jgi:hypothetical protein